MKKIIRLTESDLKRLIERVVKEQDEEMYYEYFGFKLLRKR